MPLLAGQAIRYTIKPVRDWASTHRTLLKLISATSLVSMRTYRCMLVHVLYCSTQAINICAHAYVSASTYCTCVCVCAGNDCVADHFALSRGNTCSIRAVIGGYHRRLADTACGVSSDQFHTRKVSTYIYTYVCMKYVFTYVHMCYQHVLSTCTY
jgi:hypothetical protein